MGSPPLARGIPVHVLLLFVSAGITPACAGNTDKRYNSTFQSEDHPRLRGEYRCEVIILLIQTGSPPLARGIHSGYYPVNTGFRITPACAGNTAVARSCLKLKRDHPRLRGEYVCCPGCRLRLAGSPPLARGILGHFKGCASVCGITPACAGNTRICK